MIDLSLETELLARRVAELQHMSVDAAVRRALERQVAATGVPTRANGTRHRMSIDEMLAVGEEIAAMPLLDPRSPKEIMDEINEP